jgi:hypothetical protein
MLGTVFGCGGGTARSGSESAKNAANQVQEQGGEKSIEGFGSEAQGSGRTAILAAEHGYLNAMGVEDSAKACFYLSAAVRSSLTQFAGAKRSSPSCADLLPTLLTPSAGAIARQQSDGKVTKVRVEDDRAFVVFRAPGARLYQFTMGREGGAWKVATVAASVLVPSAATLGG